MLFLLTTSLFAENLNGIFGIPFGVTRSFTKNQMKEKGWSLSEEKPDSLVFQKAFGTYANIITNNIEITFFQDKLYEVKVTFGFAATDDEVFEAFNILKKHYNLVYMSQDEINFDDGETYEINFYDAEVNRFQVRQMFIDSCPISFKQFVMTSHAVNAEKRKLEEKEKKKDTLSDL